MLVTTNNNCSILGSTYWIDVCQIDSNLLASCGNKIKINVFDKRCSKIVRNFDDTGYGKNNSIFLYIK